MAQTRLKKLLQKNRPLYGAIAGLAQAAGMAVAVLDVDGSPLLGGPAGNGAARLPVALDGEVAGWVCGEQAQAEAAVALLAALLAQEAEKRALAGEMLDKYRELNLLYTLSERLLVEPDPAAIARLALAEAGRLIAMTAGWVLLWDGRQTATLGTAGAPPALREGAAEGPGMLGRVLQSREAEIRNDVAAAGYFEESAFARCALICAPLKTEQRVLGAILLVGAQPISYAARDGKLLNTVALQVAPALEMARLYQVAVEKGRMERELQLAYQVQSGLMPEETPQAAGWQFAGRWRPARELSGDYYDFIDEGDGRLGLVVGDVADKGMPSALFMVHTRAAVRTAVRYSQTPAEAIFEANRLVQTESKRGHFVTLLYARLHTETGRLAYVNAGHNPALLYSAREGRVAALRRTGLPLGIVPDAPYDQDETALQEGDVLVLYTDGLTEAMNARQEEFGVQRLQRTIEAQAQLSAGQLADAIERALDDFVGQERPFDDLTLVVVKAGP